MRIAVIGTGFGERVVAPVWRGLGCEVEVLSPRDSAGIARVCESEVDLVSVHSPPFLHHQHVTSALDRGRNVLCDKPFGRNAAEARDMRDKAKARGVLHFLNFEFRNQPSRVKAKQLLDAGAIGRLRHISWSFIGSGLRTQKYRWLFDQEQSGGWIGAYGSHAIDTIRFLFKSEVAGCGGVRRIDTRERLDNAGQVRPVTAEDAFSSWFVMADGGTASLDTGFSTAVTMPQRLALFGADGTIEIVNDLSLELYRSGAAAESFAFPAPQGDSHDPALVPWLTRVRYAVARKQAIAPNFDDGVAVAEVMDRLRSESALV